MNPIEPLGERHGEQEGEQHLDAGQRDAELVEQLDQLAVEPFALGLLAGAVVLGHRTIFPTPQDAQTRFRGYPWGVVGRMLTHTDLTTEPLFLHCMACGDVRMLSDVRARCRCGHTSGRERDGRVVVAGPGRVARSAATRADRDEVAVVRPQAAVAS